MWDKITCKLYKVQVGRLEKWLLRRPRCFSFIHIFIYW